MNVFENRGIGFAGVFKTEEPFDRTEVIECAGLSNDFEFGVRVKPFDLIVVDVLLPLRKKLGRGFAIVDEGKRDSSAGPKARRRDGVEIKLRAVREGEFGVSPVRLIVGRAVAGIGDFEGDGVGIGRDSDVGGDRGVLTATNGRFENFFAGNLDGKNGRSIGAVVIVNANLSMEGGGLGGAEVENNFAIGVGAEAVGKVSGTDKKRFVDDGAIEGKRAVILAENGERGQGLDGLGTSIAEGLGGPLAGLGGGKSGRDENS